MLSPATDDPVLEKRARVAHFASLAMRVGYGLFALATVLFFWALFTRFTSTLATSTTVCLILGTLVLAPAIVTKYMVKAADRADRDGDW